MMDLLLPKDLSGKMIYKMNTDYEHALFDPRYFPESPKFQKMNEEFEFLFHLLSNDTLVTRKYISPEYQNYLEKRFNIKIKRVKQAETFENWIGPLKDKDLEKKINSKVFTYINLKNDHDYQVFETLVDLKKYERFPYYIKSPHYYSGMGIKKINGKGDIDQNLKWLEKEFSFGPMIAEEILDRNTDIGVYINRDETYIYKNFVDKYLQYKGTLFPAKELNSVIPIEKINEVKNLVLNAGGKLNFNFDCFTYKKNKSEGLNFCHDLNYRKSMGSHLVEIQKKYFSDKVVKFSFFNQKSLKSFNSLTQLVDLLSELENFHILSPLGNLFMAYLVVGKNEAEINEIESKALSILI